MFSQYGYVVRIKLFKNGQNAFVEFDTEYSSERAKQMLFKVPFFGQNLNVSYSKNQEINVDDSESLVDCTKSPQRFKMNNEEDMVKRVYPPCQTLHVSNLPEDITFETFAENVFQGEKSILDHV